MEEYILRLVRLGISTPRAWSICFKYFRDKDFDGLESFIAEREEALHKNWAGENITITRLDV